MLGTARTARKRMLPAILAAGQSISAIAGRDPAKRKQFQIDFAIPNAYPELAAILADPSVDAVYIPLPTEMHAEWAVKALESSKRVLCEKPLALNLTEADRVIGAARRGVLRENFSYAHSIRSKPISRIEAHFSFQASQEHQPRFALGSFIDLGCYGVDFAHRILDSELQILGVQGTRDTSIIQARSASGVDVRIESSFSQPVRQEFLVYYVDGAEQRIPREDDMPAMLEAFARMSASDPADLIRWRRNAAVYQEASSFFRVSHR